MNINDYAFTYISKDDLKTELKQIAEEGKAIPADVQQEFDRLLAVEDILTEQAAAEKLLDITLNLPLASDCDLVEPSTLEEIVAERDGNLRTQKLTNEAAVADKLHGAWLGRCCGCLLGKPVEGWKSKDMENYLKDTNQYPLSTYISSDFSDEIIEKHKIWRGAAFINNVNCMPMDDDTNYTTVGLAILQQKGADFSPYDVMQFWKTNIPLNQTFTAERAAYKNSVNMIQVPLTATHRNPYREWIGAQIRADFFGYAAAGNPALAADFAFRDACISHVKNGIYGEMWVAAMLATAAFESDIEAVIRGGLSAIPQKSRLYRAIVNVIDWHKSGISAEEAIAKINAVWDEYNPHDWCHTISNAQIVAMALLFGEGDFGKSICLSVIPAFDTDCNGATVGSVLGMIMGKAALPEKWTTPLNDTLETAVFGYTKVAISDMAAKTLEVWKSLQ